MGCPGIYTLDCYCDNQGPYVQVEYGKHDEWEENCDGRGHRANEFPHQYTDEFGHRCRSMAIKDGWRLDYRKNIYLCPKCNPRSSKYLGRLSTGVRHEGEQPTSVAHGTGNRPSHL